MVVVFDSNMKGLNSLYFASIRKVVNLSDQDVEGLICDLKKSGWI